MPASNRVRILRRPATGAAGAPPNTVLLNAELAYNEADDILYYGKGVGAGDQSTTVIPIAGPGAFVDKATAQIIEGVKTFTDSPIVPNPTTGFQAANRGWVISQIVASAGDMLKSAYDTTDNGLVDHAELADVVPWTGITGKPVIFPTDTANVSGLGALLLAKADLDSPSFTGTPLAPTAIPATNTTQVATTAFVHTLVNDVIGLAPAALNTLTELAASLGNDANFASTVTTALTGKLAVAANLSDLADAAIARTNLALGSMAIQNANNVLITGGALENVFINCGTW